MTVPGAELLRRFLLHVLPVGFVRIRYFGLLANGAAPGSGLGGERRAGWRPRDPHGDRRVGLGGRVWEPTIPLARRERLRSIEADGHSPDWPKRARTDRTGERADWDRGNPRGRDRRGPASRDRRGGRAGEGEGSAMSARWGSALRARWGGRGGCESAGSWGIQPGRGAIDWGLRVGGSTWQSHGRWRRSRAELSSLRHATYSEAGKRRNKVARRHRRTQ